MKIQNQHSDVGTLRPRMTYVEDLVMIATTTWLMIGLFLDGYAHQNIEGTLDTFFTPWHALFYAGSVATALWMFRSVWRNRRVGLTVSASVPEGYQLGFVGLGIFAFGGAVDVIWHIAWGIELEIDALLSPPHLAIVSGVLLMVTSPLRAAWRLIGSKPSMKELFPAALSMTLAASLLSFMFMYLSPFVAPDMGRPVNSFVTNRFTGNELDFVRYMTYRSGVASVLISNLLFVVPILLLAKRWRIPFGTISLLFGVVATLMVALYGFRALLLAGAALGAGFVSDLLYERKLWSRPRLFAASMSGLLWGSYLLVLALADGIAWPHNLWLGTLFWACLSSAGIALVMFPPKVPELSERIS